MPLSVKYEGIDEAQMRLEGTIVMYDGSPVYISSVSAHDDGTHRVHILDLPVAPDSFASVRVRDPAPNPDENSAAYTHRVQEFRRAAALEAESKRGSIRKVINSPKLDLEPFDLGFCNVEGRGTVYLTRLPTRKYKQGLCQSNISIGDPLNSGNYLRSIDWNTLISSQGFLDMLNGVYPTAAQAIAAFEANPKLTSFAISREFCVTKNPLGFYVLRNQEQEVAWSEALNKFSGPKKFAYLKEVLTQASINVEFK